MSTATAFGHFVRSLLDVEMILSRFSMASLPNLTSHRVPNYHLLMRLLLPKTLLPSPGVVATAIFVVSLCTIGGAGRVSIRIAAPVPESKPTKVTTGSHLPTNGNANLADPLGVDFPIPTTSATDVLPAFSERRRCHGLYTIRVIPKDHQTRTGYWREDAIGASEVGCFPGTPALIWTGRRAVNCSDYATVNSRDSLDFEVDLDTLTPTGVLDAPGHNAQSDWLFQALF